MQRASTRVYRENRASFPLSELHQFAGQWVAFSADGREIVGSARTIAELVSRLMADQRAVSEVLFEHIEVETDEINLGGAEFLSMLRFTYLAEPLLGPPPPSLPAASTARSRPLVPLTVHGPGGGMIAFGRALVDSGADDTILPLDVASVLGVPLLAGAGFAMRWRGQRYPLQFGPVELELVDDQGNLLRWGATVGFAATPMRYPLLGVAGCLEFLDTHFLGARQVLELEGNTAIVTIAAP